MSGKKEIAQIMRQKRQSLDPKIKEIYDAKIIKHLLPYLKKGQKVAVFASLADEIDLSPLFSLEIALYFPKVTGKGLMAFYHVKDQNALQPGAYGILEPSSQNKISKSEIDVFIVPMLAFNQKRYRIGYGGGYYDRYLQDAPGLKLGVAYRFQQLEESFENAYDVPCDLIITERGIV